MECIPIDKQSMAILHIESENKRHSFIILNSVWLHLVTNVFYYSEAFIDITMTTLKNSICMEFLVWTLPTVFVFITNIRHGQFSLSNFSFMQQLHCV